MPLCRNLPEPIAELRCDRTGPNGVPEAVACRANAPQTPVDSGSVPMYFRAASETWLCVGNYCQQQAGDHFVRLTRECGARIQQKIGCLPAEPQRQVHNTDKESNREFHMNVQGQIDEYIASQPEPKRTDLQELHERILRIAPGCKLWFLDGRDSENKVVSNPNIGYGAHTMKYADGTTREFFQLSISANKTGISIYIIGMTDKTYLAQTFGKDLGKASVTGYCIKFKALKDINIDVLEAAIRYGFEVQHEKAG